MPSGSSFLSAERYLRTAFLTPSSVARGESSLPSALSLPSGEMYNWISPSKFCRLFLQLLSAALNGKDTETIERITTHITVNSLLFFCNDEFCNFFIIISFLSALLIFTEIK